MNHQRRTSNKKPVLLLCLTAITLLLLNLLITCNTQEKVSTTTTIVTPVTLAHSIGLPQVMPTDNTIHHNGYTLSYNKQHKQPSWVAYLQIEQHTQTATQVKITGFSADPLAIFTTATDADYKGQGFDRGHIVSAEDMAWSKVTMQESFYYTNISPQKPAFNRGVWRRLENLVRYWSEAYDSIYIVAGPVLTNVLPTIGPHKVSIPSLFYKVVLQYNSKGTRAIGFVLPNEASAIALQNFAVTVDSVEHLTGINFFEKLPDEVEERLESNLSTNDWLWKKTRK